jgi:hypothetical protein
MHEPDTGKRSDLQKYTVGNQKEHDHLGRERIRWVNYVEWDKQGQGLKVCNGSVGSTLE